MLDNDWSENVGMGHGSWCVCEREEDFKITVRSSKTLRCVCWNSCFWFPLGMGLLSQPYACRSTPAAPGTAYGGLAERFGALAWCWSLHAAACMVWCCMHKCALLHLGAAAWFLWGSGWCGFPAGGGVGSWYEAGVVRFALCLHVHSQGSSFLFSLQCLLPLLKSISVSKFAAFCFSWRVYGVHFFSESSISFIISAFECFSSFY